MDPKPDLVTFTIPGRHPVAIRPYPDSVSVDLDRRKLKLRCDFDSFCYQPMANAYNSRMPIRVESKFLSGPCLVVGMMVAGGRDFHIGLEIQLIEVVVPRIADLATVTVTPDAKVPMQGIRDEAGRIRWSAIPEQSKSPLADIDPSTATGAALDALARLSGLAGPARRTGETDEQFRARVTRTLPSIKVSVDTSVNTPGSIAVEVAKAVDRQWGESILVRAPDESDEAMRQKLLRGVANIGPMPFHDSVRLAMADLAESHAKVPMNGDGFAIVRAAVAKRMHTSDVRIQVRPLGSGSIRIVLDEDRKVMDWPEAPPAAVAKGRTYDPRNVKISWGGVEVTGAMDGGFFSIPTDKQYEAKPTVRLLTGMTDVQRVIAHADSTGANPGSASYIVTALMALPGVADAAVYDFKNNHHITSSGQIAVVVDRLPAGAGGHLYSVTEVAQVIEQCSPAGVETLGAETDLVGEIHWFTSATWQKFIDKGKISHVTMDTHGKDIRPGSAVFTTKCARCDVSLVYTDNTRDAEAEAHKAKCFVKGDWVRWTSPVSPDCWADGMIVNRLVMGPAFSVDILAVCSGRTPGDALVGSRCSVGVDRLSHLPAPLTATIVREDGDNGTSDWRLQSINTKTGAAVLGPVLFTTDPLDVEIDGMSLRYWVGRDQKGRQGKGYPRMPTAARSAVSAYWSAELRAKITKSEADRKSRETSVVIGLDAEDL